MGRAIVSAQTGNAPVVVDHFTCNGCRALSTPTEEHLVHRDIGRVLLADPHSSRSDVRPRLESGFFSGFLYSTGADEPLSRVNFNAAIKNLLCGDCNRHKAGPFERQAAKALQRFLVDDAEADAALLRRWIWYLTLKFCWYKRPTEELRSGVLFPLVSKLIKEGSTDALRVRIADLVGDPNLYSLMWTAEPDGPFIKHALWILRGTVWIVVVSPLLQPLPEPISRLPTVELMDVRRSNLPRVRPGRLAVLPAVRKLLDDDRIAETARERQLSRPVA